jgi:hypothetical protein
MDPVQILEVRGELQEDPRLRGPGKIETITSLPQDVGESGHDAKGRDPEGGPAGGLRAGRRGSPDFRNP